MGVMNWIKGQALAASAFDQAGDFRNGTMAADRALVVTRFLPLVGLFDDEDLPLDVQLQHLVDGPLETYFEAAYFGRSAFTPRELWLLLFVAVALGGSCDRPGLARTIARLEDRAAERRA